MLGVCSLIGLTLGLVGPTPPHASAITLTALALQTFTTVGALAPAAGIDWRTPLRLVGLHLATVTAMLIVIAIVLGIQTPLGLGVALLALVPPAAGLPAYADAAGADTRIVTGFCLISYLIALVATPTAAWLILGHGISVPSLALSLGFGLLVPTLAGRACRPLLIRVPVGVRRAVVAGCLALITYTIGTGTAPALHHLPGLTIVLASIAIAAARTFGSGWLAKALWRDRPREAMLAGGFKNAALAAATAIILGHPLAALPAMLSFPFESLWLIVIARDRGRKPTTDLVAQPMAT